MGIELYYGEIAEAVFASGRSRKGRCEAVFASDAEDEAAVFMGQGCRLKDRLEVALRFLIFSWLYFLCPAVGQLVELETCFFIEGLHLPGCVKYGGGAPGCPVAVGYGAFKWQGEQDHVGLMSGV